MLEIPLVIFIVVVFICFGLGLVTGSLLEWR